MVRKAAEFLRRTLILSKMKVLLNVFLSLLFAGITKGDGRDWIRGFMGTPKDENTPLVRCVMITVASTRGHLEGHLLFINDSNSKIEIEGKLKDDGTFWPCFRAQVSRDGEKKWKTLGESDKSQGIVTVIVDALSERKICVDMDLFRPAIGKAPYGRIVLSNGVRTMFDLQLFAED
jgi:hypothetical protein